MENLPRQPDLSADAQSMQWMVRSTGFLEDCRREVGTPFTIDLKDHGLFVFFDSPQAIGELLSAPSEVLVGSRGNRILSPFLGPRSLLLLDGPAHREARRCLRSAFQRSAIDEYAEMIREVAQTSMNSWPLGTKFRLQDKTQELALEVILRVVLGQENVGLMRAELMGVFEKLLDERRFGLGLVARLAADPAMEGMLAEEFRETLAQAHEIVDEMIRRWKPGGGGRQRSVLDLLMEAEEDREGVRDELFTLIATGHETTATALAWAVHHLGCNKDVEERLRREVGQEEDRPERNAYLVAVCKEVLRITPVVPVIARYVAEPFTIDGVELPVGVTASAAIHLAHHRPETFEEPGRFSPERFLQSSYGATEYLPFGGSRRRCVGAHLAMLEMAVVLAELYRRYGVTLVNPEAVRPRRRLVTVGPSDGVEVILDR